jgi:hypothetical protein
MIELQEALRFAVVYFEPLLREHGKAIINDKKV